MQVMRQILQRVADEQHSFVNNAFAQQATWTMLCCFLALSGSSSSGCNSDKARASTQQCCVDGKLTQASVNQVRAQPGMQQQLVSNIPGHPDLHHTMTAGHHHSQCQRSMCCMSCWEDSGGLHGQSESQRWVGLFDDQ